MAEDQGEKTEEATQAKREEFRKKGQVAQTKELATVMLLFGGAISLWALGRFYLQHLSELFDYSLGDGLIIAVRQGTMMPALVLSMTKTAILLAPVLLLVGVVGLCSTVFQVGFLSVENALQPKLEKLNPIEGLKRIFSLRSLVEGVKSIAKISLVMVVSYLIVKDEVQVIPYISQLSIEEIFAYMGGISFRLLMGIAIVMAVIGAADYGYQRYDTEQKMRMSKQEIKEEHKSREGDPLMKAKIKRAQREIANRRMMEAVPKADVVITNPTHIAVVLKYDGNMPSPQIVAKGADLMAERIKEIAREHNVPVIENKPLARTIFKTLKIGHFIPRELFVAVAEVLSLVYKLKRKGSR